MKNILKKIYWRLPFKKTLFSLIKNLYVPSSEIYKHLRFKEPFTTHISKDHSFKIYNSSIIENEIFWNGFGKTWEKESLNLWVKLSKISSIIFDIGANNGIYAIVSASINANSKVYAFEPIDLFIGELNKNIMINEFKSRVFPHKLALGHKNGICTIDDYSNENKKIEVPCETVDNFVRKEKIEKVDLVKMDVENYEPYVFIGMKETIKKFRPTILVEILTDECAALIEDVIKDYDYKFYNINENGGIRKVDKLTKSDYWNFLLCSEEIEKFLDLI
tara:strand:+ start:905 stop:1732 length:828 start_codon:yes stop_codon:yes gene_type:complete